uniref:Uncharacterized protein n=1 Tax=Syphacia muris TaxID=451379 RepID=A0A0N5AGH7_9BILA
MSPLQPGIMGCFIDSTPKRQLRDEKNYYAKNEFLQSPLARSSYIASLKGRNRRLFLSSRPSSEELFFNHNRRYSYSEPMCVSAGSSPVSKTPLSYKNSSRQQQNQSPESSRNSIDRFASSRYSDSPKAKQVPLPPVDWINEGLLLLNLLIKIFYCWHRNILSSASDRSLDLFSSSSAPSSSSSFLSQFCKDSGGSPRYCPDIVSERVKICRGTPVHINALKLIEAVSAS